MVINSTETAQITRAQANAESPESQSGASTWLGRVFTFDNVMQTTIATGVMFGGMVASKAEGESEQMFEGLQIATASVAAACFLWGFGCCVKGEYAKGAKRLAISAAFLAALDLEGALRQNNISAEYNSRKSQDSGNSEVLSLQLNICRSQLDTCLEKLNVYIRH